MIKFSVVIPLYNKRNHIRRAINSVLSQTVQLFELVVVDDGSTDGSDCIVETIADSRVRLVRQPNAGVSVARNTGIATASHPYVAFLDADDEWLPQFLDNVLRLVKQFPGAAAYATNYYKSTGALGVVPAYPIPTDDDTTDYILNTFFQRSATGSTPLHSSAICVPKRTFTALGQFPGNIRLYEDLYMWTKIALSGDIAYCCIPSSLYHRDADNRACNHIVPTPSDLAFQNLIDNASSATVPDRTELYYARVFVSKYGLLNAFKALVGGRHDEARKILKTLRPVTLRQHIRRCAIFSLSLLPHRWVVVIWESGKRVKRFATRPRTTPHAVS